MAGDRGEVRLEIDGPVATVVLCRPEKKNSLTGVMFDQLAQAVAGVENRSGLRVLIIRGEGSCFCAGDDLTELVDTEPERIRSFLAGVQSIFTRLEGLSVPVLAAVQGHALGGGLELALSCDLILASESARLGLPETGLGLLPGLGGTVRLPRRIGLGRAREMVLTGRIMGAAEALGIGLVESVFPDNRFFREVAGFAEHLSSKSAVSLALAKSALNRGMDASLEAGLALEREAFAYCFSLPDAREGIRAFLEKRKPRFR